MRMYVIFVVAIAAIAGLGLLLDRGLKAIDRGRRRRVAAERLVAAASKAEQEQRQRRKQQEVSTALTSVLPAIPRDDRGPRKVA
jgi:predicted lysophospholipase L1 biosynthesis ABC-type transport system permease subunit